MQQMADNKIKQKLANQLLQGVFKRLVVWLVFMAKQPLKVI